MAVKLLFDERKLLLKCYWKVIERRESTTEFPSQSPDLTPLDLYLWGTLKNMVYATNPQTLEDLRDQIEHAINDIPLATIQTTARRAGSDGSISPSGSAGSGFDPRRSSKF